ncbi:MAG: nucleoside hydrolase, partial [Actinomycetota bacterium]
MLRVHLDTDLGSDTDDLCALAMLLGWPDVEVVGVTTVSDPGGIRAGKTRYALGLAGHADIPVTAGAEGSLGGYFVPLEFPDVWPEPIEPSPSPPGVALELLEASVRSGATVVAIGPYTNLGMFEAALPGRLADVPGAVMGGWVTPPRLLGDQRGERTRPLEGGEVALAHEGLERRRDLRDQRTAPLEHDLGGERVLLHVEVLVPRPLWIA